MYSKLTAPLNCDKDIVNVSRKLRFALGKVFLDSQSSVPHKIPEDM